MGLEGRAGHQEAQAGENPFRVARSPDSSEYGRGQRLHPGLHVQLPRSRLRQLLANRGGEKPGVDLQMETHLGELFPEEPEQGYATRHWQVEGPVQQPDLPHATLGQPGQLRRHGGQGFGSRRVGFPAGAEGTAPHAAPRGLVVEERAVHWQEAGSGIELAPSEPRPLRGCSIIPVGACGIQMAETGDLGPRTWIIQTLQPEAEGDFPLASEGGGDGMPRQQLPIVARAFGAADGDPTGR